MSRNLLAIRTLSGKILIIALSITLNNYFDIGNIYLIERVYSIE